MATILVINTNNNNKCEAGNFAAVAEEERD